MNNHLLFRTFILFTFMHDLITYIYSLFFLSNSMNKRKIVMRKVVFFLPFKYHERIHWEC
jgi:hypothetical protein